MSLKSFIYLSHSFIKCLLNLSYVQGTVFGTGDIITNRKGSALLILWQGWWRHRQESAHWVFIPWSLLELCLEQSQWSDGHRNQLARTREWHGNEHMETASAGASWSEMWGQGSCLDWKSLVERDGGWIECGGEGLEERAGQKDGFWSMSGGLMSGSWTLHLCEQKGSRVGRPSVRGCWLGGGTQGSSLWEMSQGHCLGGRREVGSVIIEKAWNPCLGE